MSSNPHILTQYKQHIRYGYCGSGKGFCFPAEPSPEEPKVEGCILEDTEIIGGDLPEAAGGGGVKLDMASPGECSVRSQLDREGMCLPCCFYLGVRRILFASGFPSTTEKVCAISRIGEAICQTLALGSRPGPHSGNTISGVIILYPVHRTWQECASQCAQNRLCAFWSWR